MHQKKVGEQGADFQHPWSTFGTKIFHMITTVIFGMDTRVYTQTDKDPVAEYTCERYVSYPFGITRTTRTRWNNDEVFLNEGILKVASIKMEIPNVRYIKIKLTKNIYLINNTYDMLHF